MQDGIDGWAFRAELRSLDRAERRRRFRELGLWLRAAARASGGWRAITTFLSLAVLGASGAIAGLVTGSRALIAITLIVLFAAQLLGWRANQAARQWRREHPFEQWRRRATI